MDFDNTFTVQAPVDEVYEALLDVERVAPAMPGASVLEKTGDDAYKVAIKVKLGPVSMTYRGDVTVVDRDPAAHTAVLDVKAKEARGQGSANAKVRMALEADGSATRGTMNTSVQLAGKAAAMSRGVIDDVSKRLVAQFAENLQGIVASSPDSAGEGDEPSPGGRGSAPPDEAAAASEPETPQEAPPPPAERRSAPSPPPGSDDVFDAGALAANMAADRVRDPKVLGGLIGLLLLLVYLLRRRA